MKKAIQNGPATIAVAAGNDCWRFYSEGVLSAKNNCSTELDHGVVIVGLHHVGDPDESEEEDDDSLPDDDYAEDIYMKRKCVRTTESEKANHECERSDAFMTPDHLGKKERKCCWYEHIYDGDLAKSFEEIEQVEGP